MDYNNYDNNNYNNGVVEKKTNTYSLIGFILSIFEGGIAALVLCIIGLTKVKEYGNGKGLAIAGIILVILRIILIIVMVLVFEFVIFNKVTSSISASTYCSMAYECDPDDDGDGKTTCYYYDEYGEDKSITCPIIYYEDQFDE